MHTVVSPRKYNHFISSQTLKAAVCPMFGRVSDSVKFVGKSSEGRGEKASQRKRRRARSSPGYSVFGMEESVTSALTEPSINHQLRSTVAARPVRPISEGKGAEEAVRKRRVYEHYMFDLACFHVFTHQR